MSQLKLTISAILLLRHVLNYTGESEVGPHGQEIPSNRKLNVEEASQRRHFVKNTDTIVSEYYKFVESEQKAFNDFRNELTEKLKKDNPKGEKENDADYNKRIGVLLGSGEAIKEISEAAKELQTNLNNMMKEEKDIEITEKTLALIKKYYIEFGKNAGYPTGDDENINIINAAFGISE